MLGPRHQMDLVGLVLGQGLAWEQVLGLVVAPGQDQVAEQEGLVPVLALVVQGLVLGPVLGLVPGPVPEQERGWGLGLELVQGLVWALAVMVALGLPFLMGNGSTKWGAMIIWWGLQLVGQEGWGWGL